MYVYIYVCMYIYIYIYTYTHISLSAERLAASNRQGIMINKSENEQNILYMCYHWYYH